MKNLTLFAIFFSAVAFCQPAESASSHARQNAINAEIASHADAHGWCLYGSNVTLFHAGGPRTWRDVTPPAFRQLLRSSKIVDNGIDSCGFFSLSANRAWLTINDGKIHVFRTADSGKHWRVITLRPVTGEGCEIISFANDRDGGMLSMSDLASHQMDKAVYRTNDGGRKWVLSSYSSGHVAQDTPHCLSRMNVPSGFTARTATDFWTGADDSMGPPIPLFHSTDAGRSWRLVKLQLPQHIPPPYLAEVHCFNVADAPKFTGPSRLNGRFHVDVNLAKGKLKYTYRTKDGGKHWRVAGVERMH